jgi:hypothetical protein
MRSMANRVSYCWLRLLSEPLLGIVALSFRIYITFLYEEGHANTSSKNEIITEVENVVLS